MRCLRALLAISSLVLCTLAPGQPARAEEASERLVVAEFGDSLPSGWEVQVRAGAPKFRVADGALHLKSQRDSYGLKKEISLELSSYPYLNWRWKVTVLPEGGDGRKGATDDQAAQVYVVFPCWPRLFCTRALGYTWENLAPRGSTFPSPARGRTRYVVLRDHRDKLGEWVSEKRNVYEDYERLFGEKPPQVGAVLLYINSQHTRTSGESYIADVYFSRN